MKLKEFLVHFANQIGQETFEATGFTYSYTFEDLVLKVGTKRLQLVAKEDYGYLTITNDAISYTYFCKQHKETIVVGKQALVVY